LPQSTNGSIYSKRAKMTGADKGTLDTSVPRSKERVRTIWAVVAASVISLVVWVLVVVLNVR
jgi:hypothetical protein